ncbi:MAG: putative DNA-binding domain-containing protein [Thiotrichaceae bacterium]|nr:putative DNA-binding domain-containing protein [Thiotrichaceae bacterium]
MTKQLPEFQRLQLDFSAHIRDPEGVPAPSGIEDRRLAIYRELFFNNVRGFLENGFPILHTHYDEKHWVKLVRVFFAKHQSHSPWFIDISKEFVEYLQQEYQANDNDPPYLFELAHFEWAEVALMVDQTMILWEEIDTKGNLLEGILVLSPTAYCLAYQWPINKINVNYQPTQEEKPAQPSFIIINRDQSGQVNQLSADPVTARIMELLQGDEQLTGNQVLTQLATEMNHPNIDEAIIRGEKILLKLQTKEIILGVKS